MADQTLQDVLGQAQPQGRLGDILDWMTKVSGKIGFNQSVTPAQGVGPSSVSEFATSGVPTSKWDLLGMVAAPLVGMAWKMGTGAKGLPKFTHTDNPAIQVNQFPKDSGLNPYHLTYEGDVVSTHPNLTQATEAGNSLHAQDLHQQQIPSIFGIEPYGHDVSSLPGDTGKEAFNAFLQSPTAKAEVIQSLASKYKYAVGKFGIKSSEAEQAYNKYEAALKPPATIEDNTIQIKQHPDFVGPDYTQLPEYQYTRTPQKPPESYLRELTKTAVSKVPITESPDIHTLINSRDSTYHATSMNGFEGILKEGKINPGTGQGFQGVSVSRVPRVASKGSKAISFVLDRESLPEHQPIAESGYQKTIQEDGPYHHWSEQATPEEIMEYNKLSDQHHQILNNNHNYNVVNPEAVKAYDKIMKFLDDMNAKYKPPPPEASPNKQFEFELRTKDQPIPLSAVKGVVVDRKALKQDFGLSGDIASGWEEIKKKKLSNFDSFDDFRNHYIDAKISQLRQKATEAGLPFRVAEHGGQMHSYRAAFSKMAKKGEPLFGVGGGALGGSLAYQLYNQQSAKADE